MEQPAYAHAYVRVSNKGTDWVTVWDNTVEITDYNWQFMNLDISAVADGQPTVYLRWTMGPTDGSWRYCGWNIDDIELWGVEVVSIAIPGDLDCDGTVGRADINPFVLALTGQAAYEAAYPNCNWYNADCNADGQVNFADINAFVALLSGP